MASDNETVSKVLDDFAYLITLGNIGPNVATDVRNRIEEAHRREVAELTAIINAECRKCGECAKFGKDCTAGDIDGAEDNRACEKFVSREVAELRECLREAVNNECNYCRTVRKDGTYGKCEHLKEDGECDHLRGVKCIVHKWRKALKGAEDEH